MTDRPPTAPDAPAPGPPRDPRRPFAISPFSRLARAHAFGIAGDALFAIALAGSVFFALDFNSARWRVALYLVLTILPFAVAAPLIGPALDRIKGGRRWVIFGSMAFRAVLCFFVIRHLDSLLFYPEAFLMLVLGKTYTISKSALVPTTVRSDTELVEANSKLTVLAAVAVVIAVVPGGILLKLGGPAWTLALALVAFAIAAGFALQLPPTTIAVEPPDEVERMELRSAAIFLASTSMGLIRSIVGFLVFMLAFDFKDADAPTWHLAVAAGAAQVGFFIGAVVAPRLRRLASEERILVATLVVTGAGGVVCAMLGGLTGAALLSLIVGATSSAAKQAFDAIIQRDAPDANRGRSFARFETRFQLFWVVGALVPIVIPIPAELGFMIIALTAFGAIGWYLYGLHRIKQGHIPVRRQGVPAALRRAVRGGGPDPAVLPDSADRPGPPDAPNPLVGTDATLIAPAPAPPEAQNPRRWARRGRSGAATTQDDWVPPPGFVAHPLPEDIVMPLADEPSPTAPAAPTVEQPAPADAPAGMVEQPTLPLDYPDPPWRDDTTVQGGA